MPPRRAEEIPLKRASTIGVKLSSGLPPGEILTDITQNSWRLGNPIGCGGFGDVYLASNEINKPVASNAKYVIKIEPHSNGPLFVEMNFYIRAARKPTIESWCKSQNISHIGIPSYEGSGSHIFEGQRYRFLVIPRYGIDVGNLFISNGRQLPAKLVNSLAIQMLYSLEYIHSKGYAHSDVKGSNILLKRNNSQEYPTGLEKTHAYLVDYGLAYRYRTGNGVHKPFIHDERRAHEGTLEFTSRDAHHGTHSRRGDLETLGYNILQWLCGRLPWEKEGGGMPLTVDPDDIHEKKEKLMVNVDLLMKECFGDKKKAPENITEYMKYIVNLHFQSRPDYEYLRSLFSHDLNLDSIFGKRISNSNENFFSIKPHRRPFLRERKPCKPVNGDVRITRNTHPSVEKVSKKADDFSWEAVLACHPDKIAKISAQIPLSPLTPPPSPPPIQSIPTYAMLQVMQRIKEKQNGLMRHRVNSKSSDNDLKPKWMTPAMEEVAQLKLKNASVEAKSKNNKRFTRSEAQRKRNNLKRKSEVDSKVLSKKRKLLTSN